MGKRLKQMDNTLLRFNIEVIGADLEDWEKHDFSTEFLSILLDCDQVEKADCANSITSDPNGKAALEPLLGVLLAEVKLSNLKPFLKFLGDKLFQNQQRKEQEFRFVIEIGERKVSLDAKRLTDTEVDRLEKMLSNIISDIS
jgi:hypothetical protein